MSDKTMESRTEQVVGTIEKKKRGRKPMTGEGKDAMAKARAAKKELADNLKPELFIQFQGDQTDLNTLLEQAKADFHAEKKRTLITDLKLYIKPEEHAAYYVINEKYTGQIPF